MHLVPNPIDEAWSAKAESRRLLDLADCFYEAAQREIAFLVTQKDSKTIDALPSYFLFNHTVELFIKAMLLERTEMQTHGHNLSKLLAKLKEVFKEPELHIPNDVQKYFMQMQIVDLKNDNYRYPHTCGVTIKLQDFADVIQAVHSWMEQIKASSTIFPSNDPHLDR
jgi:hypothetical protein